MGPRGTPRAPGPEKVTKSSLDLRSFPKVWGSQNRQFSIFLRFCGSFFGVVFRMRVLEASGHQFERNFDRFGDRFLMFFVKRGASLGNAKIIVLYWYLQYLVSFDRLTKREEIRKMS